MPTGLNEHTVRCPPKRTMKLIFRHLPKHYKKGYGSWLSCTERCFLSLSFLDMLTPSEDLGKNFTTRLRPGPFVWHFFLPPKNNKSFVCSGSTGQTSKIQKIHCSFTLLAVKNLRNLHLKGGFISFLIGVRVQSNSYHWIEFDIKSSHESS